MSHQKCKTASLKCVKRQKNKAARGRHRLSLLPSSYCHMTWTGALYPIRSVQESSQTWAQRPGGFLLAAWSVWRWTGSVPPMAAAFRSAELSRVRNRVCECTNVSSFKAVSLYVRLSCANVKRLSWTEAPENLQQLIELNSCRPSWPPPPIHPTASTLSFQPSAQASGHFHLPEDVKIPETAAVNHVSPPSGTFRLLCDHAVAGVRASGGSSFDFLKCQSFVPPPGDQKSCWDVRPSQQPYPHRREEA